MALAGRLDYSEWTDAEGQRHSRHEVVAGQVDVLAKPAGRRTRAYGVEAYGGDQAGEYLRPGLRGRV